MTRNRPAEAVGQVSLAFSDWRPLRHVDDPLHKDLSAVSRVGDCLFVACDETASVERLQRRDDGSFGAHRHFTLDAFVDLPGGADGDAAKECVLHAGTPDGVPWRNSTATRPGMSGGHALAPHDTVLPPS